MFSGRELDHQQDFKKEKKCISTKNINISLFLLELKGTLAVQKGSKYKFQYMHFNYKFHKRKTDT